MKYVIVDGYNLIFQCGLEGRYSDDRALERARERLYRELADQLPDDLRAKTTIVFDSESRPAGVDSDRYTVKGMTIQFAVGYPDADTLIMELIRKHPAAGSLTVVSSDHRIQKSARARRAHPVDSDVWYDSLGRFHDQTGTSTGNNADEPELPFSSEESNALLQAFLSSEVPIEELEETQSEEDRETDQQAAEKEADFEKGFNPFPDGWFDDLEGTL